MWDYILITVFSILVGYLGGYAGIAGAPLLIFLLTTFLDYPQHLAQGTVIAIMLGPMSLPGLIAMRGRIRPLLKYAVISILTYAAFSYAGASLAYLFNNTLMRLLFASLLLCLGVINLFYFLFKNNTKHTRPLIKLGSFPVAVLGAAIGVVGGLFGIGAGVLMVPFFIWLFKMDKDDARTLSLIVLMPPVSIGAVLKYQEQGHILWPVVLAGFVAYFISNYWGARLGRKHHNRIFQVVFSIILLVLGCVYVLLSFFK